MSDSQIHNFTETTLIASTDYFPIDVYNTNDGLYYTYKVSYTSLQKLLSASIIDSVNSRLNTITNSINSANSQLNNKVNKFGGDAMNGDYTITGNLSTNGNIELFGILNSHNQKILNVASPDNGTDAVNKNYVDNSIASVNSSIPDITNLVPKIGATMTGALYSARDPLTPTEFANKNYIDTKFTSLSNYLPLSGGTMTGIINLNTNKITNLGTPTLQTDAATKGYADSLLIGGNAKYPLAGGIIGGNIDLNNTYYVINALNPVNPNDLANKSYVDTKDANYLPLAGGTLNANSTIIVPSNSKITLNATSFSNTDAVNKQYVDTIVGGTAYLPLAGGTLNANSTVIVPANSKITLNATTFATTDAVNKQYVDSVLGGTAYLPLAGGTLNSNSTVIVPSNSKITLNATSFSNNTDAVNKQYVDTKSNSYLPLAGGTMTGDILVPINSKITLNATSFTNNTDAVNKQYVDTKSNSYLPLAGGTMTGAISLNANKITNVGTPSVTTDASTKGYVDNNFLALAGGTVTGNTLINSHLGVKTFTQDVVVINAASNIVTLDLNQGNIFKVTPSVTINSFTIVNPTGAKQGNAFSLYITQGATAYTVNLNFNSPSSLKWSGNTPPVVTSTINRTDIFAFTTIDGGIIWYGFIANQDY